MLVHVRQLPLEALTQGVMPVRLAHGAGAVRQDVAHVRTEHAQQLERQLIDLVERHVVDADDAVNMPRGVDQRDDREHLVEAGILLRMNAGQRAGLQRFPQHGVEDRQFRRIACPGHRRQAQHATLVQRIDAGGVKARLLDHDVQQ